MNERDVEAPMVRLTAAEPTPEVGLGAPQETPEYGATAPEPTPEVGLGAPDVGLGPSVGADQHPTTSQRFATPEPITVDIDRGIGHVRILAGDRLDTTVALQSRHGTSAADRKAVADTRVELVGRTLSIRALKTWRRFTLGPDGLVDVTVEVPSGSHLTGHSDLGDLDAVGQFGNCRFKTAMGRIQVQAALTLHLRSSFGDVAVDSCTGDADIATASGRIKIGEIGGAGLIRNSNGETTIVRAAGDLHVKSANGDIAVGSAGQSLTARTANGSIRVGEVVSGEIDLQSHLGDIEIGIREGSAAWLDVKTSYGTVRSSLTAGEPPTHAEQTVDVRAATSYGDVVLRRVPASAGDPDTAEEDRP